MTPAAHATAVVTGPLPPQGRPRMPRLPVLEGWRGISIVAVLMAHMLPLGPKRWDLHEAFGIFGIALGFAMAHISTHYVERPFIALGKKWTKTSPSPRRWPAVSTSRRVPHS